MHAFFVSLSVLVFSSSCWGLHGSCDVFPKDVYVKVGSSAEVVCFTSCYKGKFYWTLNREPINESLSKTINSTHMVVSLVNFTQRSSLVECHIAQLHQLVGGTIVKTYSNPREISCELYYPSEKATGLDLQLTCTWEHQTDFSTRINYTVLLGLSSDSLGEICSSKSRICTFKFAPKNWNTKSTIVIRARTDKWQTDSDPYEFTAQHVFKLSNPIVNVTAVSDHLLVTWKPQYFLYTKKFNCQVKYYETQNSLSSKNNLKVIDKSEISTKMWNITIKELESCVNYTVSVRCAMEASLWSEWSQEKTVLTKLNKKHIRINLWRKVVELGTKRRRKVHVMWSDIPSACEERVHYSVKPVPFGEDMTGDNYFNVPPGSTACDIDVDYRAHRLHLIASHNNSVIAEDSVYIPDIEENLVRVADIQTSLFEGNILVSWKAPNKPVSGYMIDWSHDGNQYYWNQSQFTNTTLTDLLEKKLYSIAVTPLFENKTGQSTEGPQTCSSVGEPGSVSIIKVISDDKAAHVIWNLKPHDACSSAVNCYKVFYQQNKGPLFNVTVDSIKNGVYLKNLNPNTDYNVQVIAVSDTQNTSSEVMNFTTKRFDPGLIVGLSVFGIPIILVLLFGPCCAIKFKKFKEKFVPNPSLSSVGRWYPQSHQKGVFFFQPVSNQVKDKYDQVYTEAIHGTSTPLIDTDCCSGTTVCRYTTIFTDLDDASSLHNDKDDNIIKPAETHRSSHPGEFPLTTCVLFSPYRSQNPEESLPKTAKQENHDPGKQQEEMTMVYVSLEMFEQ